MSENAANTPLGIHQLLASTRNRPRYRRWWIALILLSVLLVATALLVVWKSHANKGPRYVTSPLTRGDITVTVTATGNLQPIKTVDIGSEISGTIAKVMADYNDTVREGQVLVQIDTTKLQTALERSRAILAANQAKVTLARATQEENRLGLARLEEVARLSGGKVPAATELDAARAKLDRAKADLASAEAAVVDSAGAVKQGETDLSKATIRSPINGMVLKRSVEPGMTVAASLQAPVLLSLARDLAEMELLVSVSEADVGQVREGMPATFTVDAYPDKNFPATIKQVRYGATTVDNVVSYQTILEVKNADLSLRPGMTATADIKVAEHKNVLLVPNAALRFKPVDQAKKNDDGFVALFMPRAPASSRPPGTVRRESENSRSRARVWIKTAEGLKPVVVKTLLTDGRNTEVESSSLQAGDEVVTDSEDVAK